jgi:hypothetical protein
MNDRFKAMLFQRPDYIPVSCNFLGATWMRHREALDDLVARHPVLFGKWVKGQRNFDEAKGAYEQGRHVDAWGCVWSNIRRGMDAFVTGHPLPRREDVRRLRPPETDDGMPHGFMFLRLTYLRGYEEAMMDFAEEPPELLRMIEVVLEYNLRQVRARVAQLKEPQIVHFGDDLGAQNALPISPDKWRKYLKPAFAAIFGEVRRAGHYVYLHTDGHILPIIPDLIECGVNVLNPQVGANGLAGLASRCKGRVCVDLDPDRQKFPFWKPSEIDRHILDIVRTLGSPDGGLWIKAECGPDMPIENIEALCAALEMRRAYFRSAG